MKKPDTKRILEFQKLLDAFGRITRVIHVSDNDAYREETDTEHSFNLAMTTWLLATHFPKINTQRAVQLALIHDFVEIHAGDTYIFADAEKLKSKSARELAGRQQLAQEWPDFPEMHAAITEYEDLMTPEACFVYALDKLNPMYTIYVNNGYTWKHMAISLEQLHAEKKPKTARSPLIAPYWEELYALLLKQPELFSQTSPKS